MINDVTVLYLFVTFVQCAQMAEDTTISRAHSFPRKILPNSAGQLGKFRGSPRNSVAHRGKIVQFRGSPWPPIIEGWPGLILSVQSNQFVQSKTQIVQSNTRNCAVQNLQDSCRQTETA